MTTTRPDAADATRATCVGDAMSSPAVSVSPTTRLTDVTALLAERAISAVPVVEGEKLVGILSTTDLIARDASAAEDAAPATVESCMVRHVVTIDESATLDEAARRLVAGRVHRLVVVDGSGAARGVLSARDLVAALADRRIDAPIAEIGSADVHAVDVGDSIAFALERLVNARVHGLVVTDGSSPVGVFTHQEALAARRLPPALLERPVEDVMSYETICLDASTPIHRAARYCVSMNVRRLLVVRERQLVGILSVVDLVDALSRRALPAE